ncbi:DUF2716 domain-containing protein [Nonomuraea sp. NPDC046802]|uniref:DUF2716 domain-containing protein n=1 Tax=Nonomuraea sp. NPDC046802 TaxID=3154919 RepID=UPI0033C6EFF3
MPEGVEDLLAAYDKQLRGRLPRFPPVGAAVERSGPVVCIHYDTHATVDHGDVTGVDMDGLIRRQLDVFAERGEPVEWKVHLHDSAQLGDSLQRAGFTAGWERSVLVVPLGDLVTLTGSPGRQRVREEFDRRCLERVRRLAADSGPHRTSLEQLQADGRQPYWETRTVILEDEVRVLAAGWAERVHDSDFVSLGGLTLPHPQLVTALASWARRQQRPDYAGSPIRTPQYFVAEATGDLRVMLLQMGFQEITTAQSYHWAPSTPARVSRPVTRLFSDPEHDAIWRAFYDRFAFKPSTEMYPGISEPAASVTWHLAAVHGGDDPLVDQLQDVIERGLRACTPTGEMLYFLDWNHAGYRFDPARVGSHGRPRWPGMAYPHDDYYLYVTADLRMGTFGHPWECSLCVFGSDLLAEVEEGLTALLGTVLRRGGRNVGNMWTFGP